MGAKYYSTIVGGVPQGNDDKGLQAHADTVDIQREGGRVHPTSEELDLADSPGGIGRRRLVGRVERVGAGRLVVRERVSIVAC